MGRRDFVVDRRDKTRKGSTWYYVGSRGHKRLYLFEEEGGGPKSWGLLSVEDRVRGEEPRRVRVIYFRDGD